MLKPYFHLKQQQRVGELCAQARTWLDVPYHHMGESRGGVDCTKLMALIYVELAILERIDPCYYGRDWFVFGDMEVVLQAFTEHLAKYLREDLRYQLLHYREDLLLYPGDVLCMSMNSKRICNHTAMYMRNEKILHAIQNQGGVKEIDYTDYWKKRTYFLFRIMEGTPAC